MKKSVAVAFCAVAGLAMISSPDAYAQSKKKKAEAAPAAAKQWTDCSKVDPAKRDVCIRDLPTVRGPVPLAGQPASVAAEAPPSAATKAAKAVKSAATSAKEAVKKAGTSLVSAVSPATPCAKVEPSKLDTCLSRAPATKGPGWAAFAARAGSKKK
ncbi:MAG: hypothetical protein ABL908_05445 [Hyphomicrobium sp.]